MKKFTHTFIAVLSGAVLSLAPVANLSAHDLDVIAQDSLGGSVNLPGVQVNTDSGTGTTFTTNPVIAPAPAVVAPRTSAMLKKLVNTVVDSSSTDSVCADIDTAYNKLTLDEKQSFAWRGTSYSAYANATAKITGPQKSVSDAAKASLETANKNLDTLAPLASDKDGLMLGRTRAIIRSAMIELAVEVGAKTPDTARAEKLSTFISNAVGCLDSRSISNDAQKQSLDNIHSSLTAFSASWDENRSSFGPATTSTNGDASVNENSDVTVSRSSVGQDDVVIESASNVKSNADLELFAKGIVKNDEMVKSVTINSDSVAVSYSARAKFLGFIPGWVTVTGKTDAEGNVTVRKSWYSFLMAKKPKIDSATLKTEVEAAGIAMDATAQAKAESLAAISKVLKTSVAAQANTAVESDTTNVETDTTTDTQVQ